MPTGLLEASWQRLADLLKEAMGQGTSAPLLSLSWVSNQTPVKRTSKRPIGPRLSSITLIKAAMSPSSIGSKMLTSF